MCGICGIIHLDKRSVCPGQIRTMMTRMKHRGPDDEGQFCQEHVGLGFVRLSIIDLSQKGHQPMFDASNRFGIIHNGEIYNYLELRAHLSTKGYVFHSNTDTEVILFSYLEWGESCLNRFNGMWAFAIYDTQNHSLFLARDRFGVKPLYYRLECNRLIFASEIPPLLSVTDETPTPDSQTIYEYLYYGRTDRTDNTFFSGIKKLAPGHVMRIENNQIKIERWYSLSDRLGAPYKTPQEFKETLQSAISLRLRSDVPVGVCLSGGLDSSSIVSILLKDFHKKDLQTFSAVYGQNQSGDESSYIREYENAPLQMHYTTPSAETLFKDMSHFVTAHGEPVPSSSAYAQYKVMESAKGHVAVTLDGQGSDEQLAGYHQYFGFFFKGMFSTLRWVSLLQELYYYVRLHRSFYGIKYFLYYSLPTMFQSTQRPRDNDYLMDSFLNDCILDRTLTDSLYHSKNLHDALLTNFEKKLAILLKWEDRNSMIFSLESRLPFLDYRLVERTLSLPEQCLIHRGTTKVILREAMKGILPESIRCRQDKIGFGTPQNDWFRHPLFTDYIQNMLSSTRFSKRQIIDSKRAQALYTLHLNRKLNLADDIWRWINLDLWFKTFIEHG
jgi:asparagine synthase (glutamine-hydrolysing)